jgi:hypothetical protein
MGVFDITAVRSLKIHLQEVRQEGSGFFVAGSGLGT